MIERISERKKHVCNWCGCDIDVGDIYETQTLKYNEVYVWKNHLKCSDIVRKLRMESVYGVTFEDFGEYITEEYLEIKKSLDDCSVLPSFK